MITIGSRRGQPRIAVRIAPQLLVEIGHPAAESRDVGFKLRLLALRVGECASQVDQLRCLSSHSLECKNNGSDVRDPKYFEA